MVAGVLIAGGAAAGAEHDRMAEGTPSHFIVANAAIHAGSGPAPEETQVLALYPLAMLAASTVGLWVFLARRGHQLPAAPPAEAVTIAAPFALFVLMLLIQGVGVQVAASAREIDLSKLDQLPPRESIAAMTFLKSAEYVAALPLLAAAFWWQWRLRALRLRAPQPALRALLITAGAFVLAWPFVALAGFASAVIEQFVTGAPPDAIAHRTLEDLVSPDAGPSAWGLIALVVVGAAIFEEALYRGLLQESIKRFARRRWIAIAITSCIFTIMHIGAVAPGVLPALFVLSIWLGWAYEKSDSLLPPILVHMAFNALNIALALATVNSPA